MKFSEDETQLSRQEAIEWLAERGWLISVKRLSNLAWLGGGPAYERWGKFTYYKAQDLREWAEGRTFARGGKRTAT